MSNVMAGTQQQIQEVINSNAITEIIRILETDEPDVKKEAAWVVANATSGGSYEHILYLLDCDCIPPLIHMLTAGFDHRILVVVMEALENILKMVQVDEEKLQNVLTIVAENQGVSAISDLEVNQLIS
jgi:hypothetical protein